MSAPSGPVPQRPGYWWECTHCHDWCSFPQGQPPFRSIGGFIWKDLRHHWNQALLLRQCPKCQGSSLRITYYLVPSDKRTVHVLHIVGIGPYPNCYLPMMWVTYDPNKANSQPESLQDPMFDFKYVVGGKFWPGLSRPAVMTQSTLHQLFEVYRQLIDPGFCP